MAAKKSYDNAFTNEETGVEAYDSADNSEKPTLTHLHSNDTDDVFVDEKITTLGKYGAVTQYKRIGESSQDQAEIKLKSRSISELSYNLLDSFALSLHESVNLHLFNAQISHEDIPSSDRASSSFLMAVNLQTMILGTSLLSIPFCIKIAGVWGIAMIIVAGMFSLFTGDILSHCQYEKSYSRPGFYKRINASFVDMANACWSVAGGYIMKSFVYISLARNVVVLILLTDITNSMLQDFHVTLISKKLITVVWTVAVLPLLFIRKVSRLAWVSFIGLNLYIVAICAVLVVSCMNYSSWSISSIPTAFNVQGVGIATGIIINSYAVHMNLPALEASLKYPKSYRKTSAISFSINVVIKVVFGICGYLSYTKLTKEEITNNVHKFYPLEILLQLAVMFFSYFTIPLQSFVVFELIDTTFRHHFPIANNICWMVMSRVLVMMSCLFVAVLIPDFSVVVGLIGSLRGSMICLVLPALFFLKLQKSYDCMDILKRCVCYGTIVFGCIASVVGVYASIRAIVDGRGLS